MVQFMWTTALLDRLELSLVTATVSDRYFQVDEISNPTTTALIWFATCSLGFHVYQVLRCAMIWLGECIWYTLSIVFFGACKHPHAFFNPLMSVLFQDVSNAKLTSPIDTLESQATVVQGKLFVCVSVMGLCKS